MKRIFVPCASTCFTDHLPHGEGLLCFHWIKALADRGHEMTVLSPNIQLSRPYENITTRQLPSVPFSDILSLWAWSFAAQRILQKFPQNHFDLIWRMYPYTTSCPFIPHKGQGPLVIGPVYSLLTPEMVLSPSTGGGPHWRLHCALAIPNWKKAVNNAAIIFTESQALAKALSKHVTSTVEQLPAIVNPPSSGVKLDTGFEQDVMTLAFAANFEPTKRVLDFLRIVHALRERGIPARAEVVGSGEQEAEAHQLARDLGLQDHITFHGRLPHPQVQEVVAECDIFLSLRPEAYGRTMVEALACGVPIVAADAPAAREFVEENVTGILLRDVSLNSFVETLVHVYKNRERWIANRRNALESSQRWSSETVGKLLEDFFTEAQSHQAL